MGSPHDPANLPPEHPRATPKTGDRRALGPSDGTGGDADRAGDATDASLGYDLDEAERAWLEHDRGLH